MKPDRIAMSLVLACSLDCRAAVALLDSLGVHREQDTIRLDIGFLAARPERFRILQELDAKEGLRLRIDFRPSKARQGLEDDIPRWVRIEQQGDTSLSMAIPLSRGVSWKSSWSGRVLHVAFPNEVRSCSMWTNPWVIGGGVAAVLAGGTAFWLIGTSTASDGTAAPEPVPPPDFELPR